RFTGWLYDLSGDASPETLTMDAAKSAGTAFARAGGGGGTGSTFYITATAGTGTTVSPSGVVGVTQGTNQTFVFAASDGYAVSAVLVDGRPLPQDDLDRGYYTFRNVGMNHSIEVRGAVSNITLEVRVTGGSGHADYSATGRAPGTYTVPITLSDHSFVTLTAFADDGYRFKEWRADGVGYTTESVSFSDIRESLRVDLVFEKDSSSSFGDLLLWIAAAIALLAVAGLLIWFLFFYRRSYDVIKVQSSANIIGKDRVRRRTAYEFTVDGSGNVSYRVGEDGEWKPLSAGEDGGYTVPRGDVTDTLTIEVR
ncbi:MAG: hypothetical protein FWH47_05275, partial [Methanomassiliicoccaceae archaeon]|nr:hypothetical protein [Methanomassiliicoccaceae archaeon]